MNYLNTENIFNDLKQKIASLAKTNEEGFVLPPFDEKGMTIGEVPPELKAYNITSREVYDVVNDFDLSPVNLTKTQKELRKKYLNIILIQYENLKKALLTESNPIPINQNILQNIPPLSQNSQDLLKANIDPVFNLIKRIINLLIMEIDYTNSPATTPPNNKGYIAAIVVLSIIIVIMGIISITRYLS